jgi:hypothetical protein
VGMLDNAVYRRRWEAKLEGYRALGILPYEENKDAEKVLITTRDDERGGIDADLIVRIIKDIILESDQS